MHAEQSQSSEYIRSAEALTHGHVLVLACACEQFGENRKHQNPIRAWCYMASNSTKKEVLTVRTLQLQDILNLSVPECASTLLSCLFIRRCCHMRRAALEAVLRAYYVLLPFVLLLALLCECIAAFLSFFPSVDLIWRPNCATAQADRATTLRPTIQSWWPQSLKQPAWSPLVFPGPLL
jgi:hypothetical protein